jgi:hypothetical protein
MSSPSLALTIALVGAVAGTAPIAGASSVAETINLQQLLAIAPGTGAGQCDCIIQATGSIAASGSTTVDLNGAATDVFGATVSMLHCKALILIAASGNINDVQIGPGAANPFNGPFSGTTPAVAVSPGEAFVITKGQGSAVGWVVTGDIIKLANSGSGTSVGYTLIALGTST